MSICLESSRTTPAAPSIGLSVIAALPQTLRVAFYGLTSPTGCATGAPQECTDEPPEPTSVSPLPSSPLPVGFEANSTDGDYPAD
jgi:hypothetical protein